MSDEGKPDEPGEPASAAAISAPERAPERPEVVRGRPFPKGVSGNPSGRPKELAEVMRAAQKLTPAIIQHLALICLKGKSMTAVRAGEIVLERAWGKAFQPVAIGELGGIAPQEDVRMTTGERRARLEEMKALVRDRAAALQKLTAGREPEGDDDSSAVVATDE